MERLNPLNDVAFKKVFTEESLLIALLNSILDFEIHHVYLVDKEMLPDLKSDKIGILDIKAYTSNGEKINIEVQLANQYNIVERTLFYWSKMFTSDFKKNDDYRKLSKTIAINLIGFNLTAEKDFHSLYWLINSVTNNLLTKKWRYTIETLKFYKYLNNLNLKDPLHRWMVFLNVEDDSLLKEVISMDSNIQEAEERLRSLNLDDSLKKAYDARAREISDEVTRMRGAEEAGMEKGRKEGIEEGKKEGIGEGRKSIMKAMKEKGLNDKEIKKMTGLNPKDYL